MVSSEYFVKFNEERFFVGDSVFIKYKDGGGSGGVISHVTSKGIYLEVGNKRPRHANFDNIVEIRRH